MPKFEQPSLNDERVFNNDYFNIKYYHFILKLYIVISGYLHDLAYNNNYLPVI